MKTLVVAERKGTDLRRVTVELAAAARELGEATVVEIAGERYSPLPFVSALAKKVESEKPDLVLLGATLNGRDLGARLAARLGRAYAADVTGFRPAGNALEVDPHATVSLRVSSPRRRRELTVPRGRSSSSAISPGV